MASYSVITVTYNAAANLRHCFVSLSEQESEVEHIVVDGGSTDGTLEIIEENKTEIAQFVSEGDEGIYDALNKGIRMATGDVVGILHADDFYASKKVLRLVSDIFQDETVDACYGDLVYVKQGRGTRDARREKKFEVVRYWKSGDYDVRRFYWGWMPPHPTFFVRRSVYEKYGLFNLDLGTAADYELMLRFLVKQQICSRYIPEVLVCMRTGGASNASFRNRIMANRNDRKAWDINGLKPYPWTIPMKPLRKIPQWFRKPPNSTLLNC